MRAGVGYGDPTVTTRTQATQSIDSGVPFFKQGSTANVANAPVVAGQIAGQNHPHFVWPLARTQVRIRAWKIFHLRYIGVIEQGDPAYKTHTGLLHYVSLSVSIQYASPWMFRSIGIS